MSVHWGGRGPGHLSRHARAAGSAAFSPESLLPAAWYDPSDTSSMFQDGEATIPAAVDSPVAYIADKSGNGNHLTQGTDGTRRPILRAGGYLEFDGVNDVLVDTFPVAQPWDRVSAIRQITWVLSGKIYDGLDGGGAGLLYQSNASPELRIYDGGGAAPINTDATVGNNLIVTERKAVGTGRIAVNAGAFVSGATGSTALTGLAVGANSDGTQPSNIRWYGCVLGTFTDGQITSLRAYYAEKAGVTL